MIATPLPLLVLLAPVSAAPAPEPESVIPIEVLNPLDTSMETEVSNVDPEPVIVASMLVDGDEPPLVSAASELTIEE